VLAATAQLERDIIDANAETVIAAARVKASNAAVHGTTMSW
jgi:hypothetical protein